MKARFIFVDVFIAFMMLVAFTSCNRQPTVRILFIGNSYTYVNDGIDKQLGGLAPSGDTERIAVGGYTLEQHWRDGNALQSIRSGGYQYVILQEQSQTPIFDRSKFEEFATSFDKEIKKSGARTVLLMTWERPDSRGSGVTTANLAAAYRSVGSKLGARVAPVGLAFARSVKNQISRCTARMDTRRCMEPFSRLACYTARYSRVRPGIRMRTRVSLRTCKHILSE